MALPDLIAPSILSADFARLGEEVDNVLRAGADIVHFDVMDNHYVPNLTIGPLVCEALRKHGVTAPIDVHLMIRPVDRIIPEFAAAGADLVVAVSGVDAVVAVAGDSPAQSVADLPDGVRVQSEYPELTRRFFADHGVDAEVRLSYGATEAKIPDIADCVVEITETGRALRAAGLKVIDTILSSYTEVVANPVAAKDPEKRRAMDEIMTLLNGVLDARGRVLLKLNVTEDAKDAVLAVLPSMKSPTMSPLAGGGYAVESVVEKQRINLVIPALIAAGATDLVEMAIAKIVP